MKKIGEFIRIIVFGICGAILMFWLQPIVYDREWLIVKNDDSVLQGTSLQQWLADDYTISALIVYVACMGATVIWYILGTIFANPVSSKDKQIWRVIWMLLALLPLISIIYAALFYNRSETAQISLVGFYIMNALLLFWLPTATSSPEAIKYIPPVGFLLRHEVMGD